MALSGANRLATNRKLDLAAEQALVEQCRRQDLEAFSKIVDAYQARVFGFVRRMVRNEEEAMDVTQEVFIRAFRSLDRFDGRSSLRTWLFRIAHNLCIDKSRRLERRFIETSLEPTMPDDEPIEFADERWDPEQAVLSEEMAQVVERAIASMSEKLRVVLLLHDKEDMGYDEIARAVDVPVGTVKSRLFLARAHLQRQLSQYLEYEVAH
ncbi:MAG TPA: sigma-70 family RNA polymerase sigma factor [Fimbriimonadaceae bacterium]|nr:sigma-70 family RNA polymerase sigma factor [Fimbriimonadaceae bacterium]